ncbi:hypothetical protein Ptr902_00876 [Pyrenophora tritici-repentis]|nr:hypothetical protein L13192_00836 [Pyrenophora tritici-repentis]KAI2486743.1 hypothetical protein Ptr902_00876 [Pyrenophora tritici-repentis]
MQKEDRDMRDDGDVGDEIGDRCIVTYSVGRPARVATPLTDSETTPATEEKESENLIANNTPESVNGPLNARIIERGVDVVESLPESSDEEVVFKGRAAPANSKSVREKSRNRITEKARKLENHTRRDEIPRKNSPDVHADHQQQPPEADD